MPNSPPSQQIGQAPGSSCPRSGTVGWYMPGRNSPTTPQQRAGSASRRWADRRVRAMPIGEAGPPVRSTDGRGRPNQPGGAPCVTAPGRRAPTDVAPLGHHRFMSPQRPSSILLPSSACDRRGHRLSRCARPAHHCVPVGRVSRWPSCGRGRPVAGRGAVSVHPGGRGARNGRWLCAGAAPVRSQLEQVGPGWSPWRSSGRTAALAEQRGPPPAGPACPRHP